MGTELVVRPQPPAKRPGRPSVPGMVFGTRPTTIARRTTLMLVAAVVLYFGALGSALQRIDADPDFAPPAPVEGGSHAVNMAMALIEREAVVHRWAPNDPAFFPTGFHDNMANYQRGILRATSRFMLALETQIGRLNGMTAIDPDLERAAGQLQFPTDVWIFDFEQSVLPVQPSDSQYRAAASHLRAYNQRVAAGTATFETRADALVLTIERMVNELGARAALIDQHTQRDSGLLDGASDDIFYVNKGMNYATYLLLRELGRDFERVIATNGIERVWAETTDSLRTAAIQRPLVVMNSSGAGSVFANHLHLQGFYMKRAVLQLEDVMRVLRNAR